MMTLDQSRPFTGRKFLLAILAFFGVVIVANVTMMTFALRTHTGLVVPNSYVASQDFSKNMAAARAQAERGWRNEVGYADGMLTLSFRDRDGRALDDLSVAGVVGREVTSRQDRNLVFRSLGEGRYAAPVELGPGLWRIEIDAADGRLAYHRNTTFTAGKIGR